MAVEIRELVIQGKVNENTTSQLRQNPSAAASKKSADTVVTKLSYSIKKQIIEDCVNEVMEKLNKSRKL